MKSKLIAVLIVSLGLLTLAGCNHSSRSGSGAYTGGSSGINFD